MSRTALARGAGAPPRWRLAAAVAVAAGLAAPTAAVADEAPEARYEVDGTVVYTVADPLGEHEGEHFHEGSVTQVHADVAGTLLDLSAVEEPLVGAEPAPADALSNGSAVVVTIEAEAGLAPEEVVALAASAPQDGAPDADLRAQVVDVVPAATAALAPVADLAGVHDLVVLPVVWRAGDASPVAALQSSANATATYWERQSAGRLDIRPSVRAAQVVPRPATCDVNALMAGALRMNPGLTPSATTHVAVHFPSHPGCGFGGQASITGGNIWLNGYTDTFVLAHELGHNFGLGHANTLTCTAGGTRVALTADLVGCSAEEYGDNADVMGGGRNLSTPGNISTGFAHHLGWATVADATGPVTTTRDVTLAPLASTGAQRGLRVSAGPGPVFFDFRPAVGPDALHEPGWAGVQSHLILTDGRYRYPTSYLLDMQPAQPAFTRPFLPVGGSWEVPGGLAGVTTTSTSSSATVRVGPGARAAQVQQYVTRVYADLFGRQPDPTGLSTWTTKLLSGTPRIAVANAITYSDEYRSRLIAASYQTYLGRGPDPRGAASWLTAMRNGSTIQQMEVGFVASDEYYAKAGGTNARWVGTLYQQVLGRNAAASEVQRWTAAMARGTSRSEVARGFLVSTEHLTTVVDGYYVDLLGRHIDATGRRSWVSKIQAGARVEAIIGGIIASDEYFGKA